MRQKISKQSGFTAIELLITLFIAAAFLVSGYQLYSVVIKDGGQTRAQAKASNVTYDYLRRYSTSASTPCLVSTPLSNSPLDVSGLSAVTVTVDLSCPYANLSGTSKVTTTFKYNNNPQQTVTYSTYTNAPGTTLESGLVGWWPMNGNANDNSGNGNNGTVSGATLTTGENGYSNSAYSFSSASSSSIQVSIANWPTTLASVSVSLWAKVTGTGNSSIIWANPDDGANRFNIHFPWNDTIYWDSGNISSGGGRLSLSYNSAWTGVWAHWVFTSEPGVGMKIYRNGSVVASNSTVSSFTHGTKVLYIGELPNGTSFWNGILDDLRIYDRSLSSDDVSALYGLGAF